MDNLIQEKLKAWSNQNILSEEAKRSLSLEILKSIEDLLATDKSGSIDKKLWHEILNTTGKYPYLKYLPDAASRNKWAAYVFKIIQISNYSLNDLLNNRVKENGEHILYRDMSASEGSRWTYKQIHLHIKEIAAVFYIREKKPRVAIFSENSVESASCDLACLCYDIFDTPLNVHFNTATLGHIFKQLKINIVVTDTAERLKLLEKMRGETGMNFTIYVTDSLIPTNEKDIFFLGEQCKTKNTREIDTVLSARKIKNINQVATTMFTSGSTGMPKGVSFSIYNLVSKRFARAAALPNVGLNEVLLCYLPLYHTFGRFLELIGSIFWQGTYVFTGNPSSERLLSLFPRLNPTGFISIPLRWQQLYEKAISIIDSHDSKEIIENKIKQVTGERLGWGLSAAGYLDPKVFIFFQEHGIHLCSGFGMTEATGGITMTPPGQYIENTTGIPLPGVKARLGNKNELEISGHYIARYLEDAGPEENIDYPQNNNKDYWLPTGDVFKQDEQGYYEIIDRVKDIYKNNKGQTIAPRTVEKRFVDVPGIKQTFLVGDGKPYNVLLIVPDYKDAVLQSADKDNRNEYFHQIVMAANKDLAPYERVVNFALLKREFKLQNGELTQKGSFNRKVITENFKESIEKLYIRNYVELTYKGLKITIPRWFFRDLGILENDIVVKHNGLYNKAEKQLLFLSCEKGSDKIQIGDLIYSIQKNSINLGSFVLQPKYWLGNPALISFGPCKEGWDIPVENNMAQVKRPKNSDKSYEINQLPILKLVKDQKLSFVNNIISLALFGELETSIENTRQIAGLIKQSDEKVTEVLRRRLEALSCHPNEKVRVLAYRILLLDDPNPDYKKLFPAFIQSNLSFLNEESIAEIARRDLGKQHLESLRQRLYIYRLQLDWPANKIVRKQFENILKLLYNFASRHIEYYNSVRSELSSWILHKADPHLSKIAKEYFKELYHSFQSQIELKSRKYSTQDWVQKIIFDKGIVETSQEILLELLTKTSFVKQSVFLAYDEQNFHLAEVPDNGIWITRLMSYEKFKHYRISVNTNYGKHFDLHLMLNKNIRYSSKAETVYWLATISGNPYATLSLPALGCYLPEHGVLTTKFVGELSIWEKVREFAGIHHSLGYINIRNPWRKLFIKGLAVFYKAWQQSGYNIVPGAITPTNVVVPELDYLETATIISVAGLKKYENTLSLIKPMIKNFFQMLSAHYPWCKKQLELQWIFDACVEGLGYKESLLFFENLSNDLKKEALFFEHISLLDELNAYLSNLKQSYYLPLAVYGAIDSYKEWEKINLQATSVAKEQTIFELSGLYRIYRFPEIVRFYLYRYTYFENAEKKILVAFDALLAKMNMDFKKQATQFIELSDLQSVLNNDDDKNIFSRMVYSRLQRRQKLDIVKHGEGGEQVVVKSYIKDKFGNEYTFREPLEPSEIGKLYRLFFEENYPKSISEMDKHMVVVDKQGRVIGGLCYILLENHVVLLDGSAVTTPLKGRGIGSAMIDNFSSRMASEGVKVIKAHFLLGNFYLKLDFKVDQKWGALVKFL